ncbi:hypothetical protein AMTR_s00044p00186700 [Amborella trichopoda]|uniref:Uncharacterized protein n=1 Tax=Amborella trichopoda TaxID=13333 RepID=U5D734_AMBTC|nr:hypothetical protein AMTR_s00044p00186700 [Amborella trichopoda]
MIFFILSFVSDTYYSVLKNCEVIVPVCLFIGCVGRVSQRIIFGIVPEFRGRVKAEATNSRWFIFCTSQACLAISNYHRQLIPFSH